MDENWLWIDLLLSSETKHTPENEILHPDPWIYDLHKINSVPPLFEVFVNERFGIIWQEW